MSNDQETPLNWIETTLGDTCGLIRDGTHLPPKRVEEGPLLLSVQNMIAGRLQTTPSDTRVTWEFYRYMHRSWTVMPNDVLLAIVGATIGKVCKAPEHFPPFTLQRSVAVLRGTESSLLSTFLYWVVSDESFTQQIWQRANQTAQPGLYLAEIQQLRFLLPSLQEQRKIDRVLTTVDNLIEKTEALIAKYQAIKQGMMHDLFTRGVDEHGHLRPPYEEAPELYKQSELGWIPKEWKINRLKEVAVKIQDGTHFSPKTTTGPCRYITSKNVRFGYMVLEDCGWISQSEHNAIYQRCDVRHSDVLLTKDGANTGNACLNELTEPFSLLSSVAIIRFDGVTFYPDFCLHYLLSPVCQQRLKDLMAGNAITRLTLEKINKLAIPTPNGSEQRRIADRFNAQVNLMRAEEQTLAKYRHHKAGLMQDLLTGKVRVKVDEAEEVGCV